MKGTRILPSFLLEFYSSKISSSGISVLTNLRTLNMSAPNVDLGIMPLTNLTSLELCECFFVSAEGIMSLTNLTDLNIIGSIFDNPNISDFGIQKLVNRKSLVLNPKIFHSLFFLKIRHELKHAIIIVFDF